MRVMTALSIALLLAFTGSASCNCVVADDHEPHRGESDRDAVAKIATLIGDDSFTAVFFGMEDDSSLREIRFKPHGSHIASLEDPMLSWSGSRLAYYVKDLALLARFPNVIQVEVADMHEVFCAFESFASLELLEAQFTPVDDDDAQRIRQLGAMRFLGLGGTRITDEAIAGFAHHKHLVFLDVSDTGITDASLSRIVGLPSLRWISVGGTGMTMSAIAEFLRRSRVEVIYAHGIVVDEAPVLVSGQTVQVLDLSFNDLSNVRFGELPRLETLLLNEAVLSPHAVSDLEGLGNLREVHVFRSVNPDLVRRLNAKGIDVHVTQRDVQGHVDEWIRKMKGFAE